MAFLRQTWTLAEKTLTIVFFRHWLGTLTRAFFAPVIFMFFIAYAKNFFVPPSQFGIGSATPLRSLSDALSLSAGGRNTVVFVNGGFTGGDISRVIHTLVPTVEAQGMTVHVVDSDDSLLTICKSSPRAVSQCFGAISFHSSPTEGSLPIWNYTIRADGAFGERMYVDSTTNDAEIYALPIQHAVDNAIASLNGTSLPAVVEQYPYTSQTPEQRDKQINKAYMGSLISILAVAYFVGIIGVCYQLTGEMAKEREMGMSQLLEAMMPNRKRWTPQAARFLSLHLAFDTLYLPSWIVMAAIVAKLNYPLSGSGVMIGYFIMCGLALSSWSMAFASLFRKAQLSGITVVITSLVLAIIVQVQTPKATGATTILAILFTPMNFVLFIIYMARWQQHSLPVSLSHGAPGSAWQTPGYVFFLACALQIIIYPLIGALIERSLYGTASKERHLRYDDSESPEALKLSQLSKEYRPNWFHRRIAPIFTKDIRQSVRAVNDIDVTVLRGQILVLLGANGSGKSTTLDLLAGLQAPTGGTIEMDATGGVGLCPQKNVLWDELTVYEHVRIFNRLKAKQTDSKDKIQELVLSCDLEQKMNAPTRTLSGGQKRKCQLAMMLTGGSSLCMLDEVSSGLDPLSRRKIWDILLAERGKRSILLTTHFLDEADLLSDDITVLSKGSVVASGSAVALKHQLGGGYRVRVYHENNQPLSAEMEATDKQVFHDQTVYRLGDSAAAASFIAELERVGVRDYQVNGPTIEDVFLKLAEEVREELEKDRAPSPSYNAATPAVGEKELALLTGKDLGFAGQTVVLFRKRLTILRRNAWPYLAALLIPVITGGLVTFFIHNFSQLTCSPSDQTQVYSDTISLPIYLALGANIPAGPASKFPSTYLNLLLDGDIDNSTHIVDSIDAFNKYISTNFNLTHPGGIYLGDTPTFAWRGNYDMSYAIATMNLLDLSLLKIPIITSFQPFDINFSPSAGNSLQFILYFGLAMSAYPGFFALYTNIERLRNVRALHYSNGIRAGPLWCAYILFDFVIVLLVSVIAIAIFVGVSGIWYGPGQLFVVFAFYGLSATLMSYLISLVTTSQLATFAVAAGAQCSMFLLYFICYMCIITYAAAADVTKYVNYANWSVALFFPAGNLLRALLLSFNEFSLLCREDSIATNFGSFNVYGGPILYCILQSIVFLILLVWSDSGWKPPFLARTRQRAPDIEDIDEIDPEVFAEAKRVDSSADELRVLHATKVFGSNVAIKDVTFGVPKGEVFALLGPNGAGKSTTIGLIRGDTRPSDRESDILVEDISILRRRAVARAHLGVCPQFDAMDQMTAIEHLRFYARARGVADVEHNVDRVIHAVGLSQFKSRMAGKLSGGNKRKLSLGIALMGNPSVLLLDEPSSGMDAASKRVMWRTLSSVSSGRSLVLTTHSMEEADALADRAGIMARKMLALGTADQLRKKHGDAYHVHLVHKDAPYTSDADMDTIKAFIQQTFRGASTEQRVFHGQLRFSVPNDRTVHSIDDVENEKGAGNMTIQPADGAQEVRRGGISALFSHLEANKEKLGFEYYSVSQATLDQVFLSIVSKHNVLEENYAREHQKKEGWGTRVLQRFGAQDVKGLLTSF